MEKQDYQKTLNLPKTDFSMRAGLVNKEPALLEKWKKDDLYGKLRKKAKGQTPFILHDGPPYANGNIHIGHALNKLLKDFIIKFKTMQGFDSLYVPGWDCHGLPIEHQMLKELKQKKSEINCLELRKMAQDYALKYVETQKEQFKRLGIYGQWDDPYLTLKPNYEYWILKSLQTLQEKGYIYRGLKPVNWCFRCETALAEAEVEHQDHTSPSVYVKFKVQNPQTLNLQTDKDIYLLIWTTTPWTLLANVAVAIHAHFQYSLIECDDAIIIIESSLHQKVLSDAGITNFHVLKEVDGQSLTNLTYTHPFDIKDSCRVVSADYVTKEAGTGLVHTAPGHGQDDFETGVANNLDIIMPVNDRGVYTEKAGKYAGEHVFKANPRIIEDLKNAGVLFASKDISHSYPHCWRCKSPIIFRATEQWFFKIDHNNLRGRVKEIIQNDVQWIPENGQERILSMVSSRPDWCLSRQRYWGVPIPALECKGCGGAHKLFPEIIAHFANMVKTHGTDVWSEKPIEELIPKGFKCPDCQGTTFEKTHDILDVWFDSGVSHQAVVKTTLKKTLPIDLYLEGSDQHRGWFQSAMITAVGLEDKAPYKAILTHGFVVDGQGRKMSKSMGNVISPLNIIKQSGADILRLWVASSSYNEDIRISKEIMDRLIDSYRKIRNTLRYLLGNLNDFDPNTHILDYNQLTNIDKWALYQLNTAINTFTQHFEHYEFSKAVKTIYTFCNEDLSSFYLDILKDRLYTSQIDGQQRRAAQSVLFHILNHLVRVLAPILSFTTEEVFASMPKHDADKDISSVHLLSWLKTPDCWKNPDIEQQFNHLVKIRPHVLKALENTRRKKIIGSSLEARIIFKTASSKDLAYLKEHQALLPSTFIVSQVEIEQVDSVKHGLSEEFSKTAILIEKASGNKCGRCWNYKIDVGQNTQHTTLCQCCVETIKDFKTTGV